MNNLFILGLLLLPLLFSCSSSLNNSGQKTVHAEEQKTSNIENGTYRIENKWVRLVDGRAETEIVPGVASKTITTLFASTEYGDLNGDANADAALLLVQQGGGSGSFFYVSAALKAGGGYQGTNAVFLGDRIAPQKFGIKNGIINVLYNERLPDEPMVATPSVSKTKRLRIKGDRLEEITPPREDERLEQGWVIIGHEVRSFLPCREKTQHWLLGDSPALPEIMAAYSQSRQDLPPYLPHFMVLAGVSASPPEDGFGNDYGAAFRAKHLVAADPQGHCRSELIVVDNPAPGTRIITPLKVTGKARGLWYFEGDFPLLLTDAMGRVLAKGFATAQGPWMTKDWVPFTGTLNIQKHQIQDWGWLILKKDNPSDRPELDDAVAIPVILKPESE